MYQTLLCLGLLAPAADPPAAPPPADGPTVCVIEPTVKKVTHPAYATKCTDYCLPHRSLLKTLMGYGDEALCCGEVRVKHQLVKKTVTEEKCELKCVPKATTCEPACPTPLPTAAPPK